MGHRAVVVVGGVEVEADAVLELFLGDGVVGFADAAPGVGIDAHKGPAVVPFVAFGGAFVGVFEGEVVFAGVGDAEFVGEDTAGLGSDGVNGLGHVAEVALAGVAFLLGFKDPFAGEGNALGFDDEGAVDFLEDALGNGEVDLGGDSDGGRGGVGGVTVSRDGIGTEELDEFGDGDALVFAAEADEPANHAGVGDVGEADLHAFEDPVEVGVGVIAEPVPGGVVTLAFGAEFAVLIGDFNVVEIGDEGLDVVEVFEPGTGFVVVVVSAVGNEGDVFVGGFVGGFESAIDEVGGPGFDDVEGAFGGGLVDFGSEVGDGGVGILGDVEEF